MLAWLFACAQPERSPAPRASIHLELDAPRLARRMSVDLRGVLPTAAELDAVDADPAALDELREAWLDDPRFEERMVGLYQERWRTRVDAFQAYYYDFGLDATDEYAYLRAVGEEPLRLIARVVAEDAPYTDIVTAEWVLANEMTAGIFPIDYPADAAGWTRSSWTDTRPPAGVLSTNGLWWRYISPINNHNRARANAILDLLVCEDLLARPVVLSETISLEDGEGVDDPIRTEAACISCHATVEPLAVTLFGFINQDDQSALEMTRYHAEREELGVELLAVEPAWFGQPVAGLEDLGRAIALDSRFVDCAVETMAQGLLRRPVADADDALLRDARDRFVEGGLRMKGTIRAVTESASYRAGALTDDATETELARETTQRILVADQLRSILADLTGFAYTRGGADLLDWDGAGFRVLAGGVDGESVTSPQRTPGLTWAMVTRRVAQAAARDVVDHDLAEGSAPILLTGVTASTVPADAAFREQVADLAWRLFATRLSEADLDAFVELWTQVHDATASPTEAWASVVTVMLRDPAFLTY